MRRLLAAALLALTLALAAGCDGDDSDPTADFRKRADRICLRSGLRPKAIPNDNAQAARQLAEEAELRTGVIEKLRALDVPDELREDFARFLALSERVAGGLRDMSAAARADEDARLGELGRRTTIAEDQRQRLGERMKFRRCGRPITDPVRSASQ
jgi:hypothetical protein